MQVVAPSRLHIGLLDLGYASARAYGGIGFAIAEPRVRVSAIEATSFSIAHNGFLDARGQMDLTIALDRLFRLIRKPSAALSIDEAPPRHIGLGSKTATLLAVLNLCATLVDADLPAAVLQSASGRGGTSGVGVHTHFRGGWVWDAGQPVENGVLHRPSSDARNVTVPPLNVHVAMPPRWTTTVFQPRGVKIEGADEGAFFRTNTPTPRVDALATIAEAYHGVLPAVLGSDLAALRRAIHRIQSIGFKKAEIANQSTAVHRALELLYTQTDAAVGMSSLGPTVYAIHEDNPVASAAVVDSAESASLDVIARSPAHNEGAVFSSPTADDWLGRA